MGSYCHKGFVCPYYGSDSLDRDKGERILRCEPCVTRFRDDDMFHRFARRFCAGNWRACSIARLLNERYEAMEDDGA